MLEKQCQLQGHYVVKRFQHLMLPAQEYNYVVGHECKLCGLHKPCIGKTKGCLLCVQAECFREMHCERVQVQEVKDALQRLVCEVERQHREQVRGLLNAKRPRIKF
jgi:hypothetical protein|eukprot:COSAG01_NODE_11547_length_1906_cov_2.798008_3_plen_106_part_00